MGGALPPRYRSWVLHDLTVRTWRLRQLVRSLVQTLPVAAIVLIFLPSEPWVRVVAVLGGVYVGMVYAFAFSEEAVESRALKAGYARGTAKAVRDEADAGAREAAAARYAARWRAGDDPTPRSSG